MKRFMFAAAVVVFLAGSAAAQNATPNFSGTWSLDIAKSDFGPAPPPESVVMVIEHKEPKLKVTTTQKAQQGDTTNEANHTTDGKENVNKMRAMGGEQDVKSTTTWNGKKLAIARTLEVQGMSVGIKDSWELSADGKVITIVREIATPQGDLTTTQIFNKQ